MVTCRDLVDGFCDYLEDEQNGTRGKFDEHINICPPCGILLTTYRKTVSLTQRLRCEDIPEDVRDSLREFLRERASKV